MLHRKGDLSNNEAINLKFPYRIRRTTHSFYSNYPSFKSKIFFPVTWSVIYKTQVPELQCKGLLCLILKSN